MRKFTLLSFAAFSLMTPALTGCGFTPMHAPGTLSVNGIQPLQQISLDMKDGRSANDKEAGFYLQQRLRDRMSTNVDTYTLTITPSWQRRRLGISGDDVASRYDGVMDASYTLTETKTGNVLDKGSVSAVTTFGASEDPYGVITANDNAMQNTAAEAADRLIVKLAGYFTNAKDAPAP